MTIQNGDTFGATALVHNVVVEWLSNHSGIPSNEVNISWTLAGTGAGGFGLSPNRYDQMCDQITPLINIPAGRTMFLSGPWRDKNAGDTVSKFITSAAIALLASPINSVGAKGLVLADDAAEAQNED